MRGFTVSVLLPTLVAGSLKHAHKYRHAFHQRALVTESVIVTEVVTQTVTAEPTSTTESSLSSANSTTSVEFTLAPSSTVPKPSGDSKNPYPDLTPEANTASVLNSCEYPVYIWSAGQESCSGTNTQKHRIEANGTYTEDLRVCKKGGISLKLSKDESPTKPMQFEYTVWQDDITIVSYDISYLDCENKETKDASGCAGHDGGIQAVGGGDCKKFHCLAGEWCDKMAYVVEEFGYLPGAPVGGCKVDHGIAFELCAGNRAH